MAFGIIVWIFELFLTFLELGPDRTRLAKAQYRRKNEATRRTKKKKEAEITKMEQILSNFRVEIVVEATQLEGQPQTCKKNENVYL